MAIQRRPPQRAIRRAGPADLVAGDELRFGFLDLQQAPELCGLGQLAVSENLRVRLEDAHHSVRVVRFASEDAGAGLG